MGTTAYQTDIVAWANEQAALIRMGKIDQMDLEHIAEEIEDVGKSEQRELENRMALLLAHLIKWRYQPERRGVSWLKTIKIQRKSILVRLKKTPSLTVSLNNAEWLESAWDDSLVIAAKETGIGIDVFPEVIPWEVNDVLTDGWLPE
ncbi:MAG TPA: DUF29 domain-containing protein [Aquirhabdus sp.]